MTNPTIRTNQPRPPRPVFVAAPGSTPTETPQISPDHERDSAISDVSSARTRQRPARSPSWNRAADLVARTYEESGRTGVNELLRRNPDVMRAIATGPADAIEDRMQDVAGYLDGSSALSVVQDFVQSTVRDAVATSAQQTIQTSIRDAEAMRTDILANFDRYRNAPALSLIHI